MTGLAAVVYAADNDPWACKTYRENLGDHIHCVDVNDVDFSAIPIECDILLASPPCQDFSYLWNRDGVLTNRGALFTKVASFLAAQQPKAFVLENVSALVSANNGVAWTELRRAIRDPRRFLGLPALDRETRASSRYNLTAEIVDFVEFGVPQHRQRLIVMGLRSDLGGPLSPTPRTHTADFVSVSDALDKEPISANAANHEVDLDGPDVVDRLKLIEPGKNYTTIPPDHPLAVKGLVSHVYRRLDPSKPSYTVIAAGGGGTHGYHHREPRRLSNRERARLQSFPDSFVFFGPGSRAALQYPTIRRQIGNAVPPQGAKALLDHVCRELMKRGEFPWTQRSIEAMRRRVYSFIGDFA